MMPRNVLTSEQRYIQETWLDGQVTADVLHDETTVSVIPGPADYPNPLPADEVGEFQDPQQRRLVSADDDIVRAFADRGLFPGFLAAGPREQLRFDPCTVRAAIVAAGGTAPGTNAAIHAIVRRHGRYVQAAQAAWDAAGRTGDGPACTGQVLGIKNGFEGLMAPRGRADVTIPGPVELRPEQTVTWRDLGGCQLGLSRYDFSAAGRLNQIAQNLLAEKIDILYVIGGDGGMHAALELHNALRGDPAGKNIVIAGIPKTMDNDIAWTWQSLGHRTALAEAARLLDVLHTDAEANRRVILVELFGADAGFIAATAALASGKADCVLIPEEGFDPWKAAEYVADRARAQHYALVVVAEGALLALGKYLVSQDLAKLPKPSATGLRDPYYGRQDLRDLALRWMRDELRAQFIKPPIFTGHVIISQPGYLIRAVAPGAEDLIAAARLGDLAVDSALAGHSGFMLTQWLTGHVLVPLPLVAKVEKRIARGGIFWREVASATGQPELS
ncbi:MAG: 6-phosphofructokinase [Armatimonadota bacterium]|nr:MAG: 6-phosphofructokinase [Armatimonadota bacterium]